MILYIFKNELKNTSSNFNAFLAFLYKEKSINGVLKNQQMIYELLYKKHLEEAKVFKMKTIPPEELHPLPEEIPPEDENL